MNKMNHVYCGDRSKFYEKLCEIIRIVDNGITGVTIRFENGEQIYCSLDDLEEIDG